MSKFVATKNLLLCSAALLWLVAAAGPVAAQSSDEGWLWDATIYLWRADVGGQTAGGSDINVDFGQIVDVLDYGFMGTLGARKGKWSVYADLALLDLIPPRA